MTGRPRRSEASAPFVASYFSAWRRAQSAVLGAYSPSRGMGGIVARMPIGRRKGRCITRREGRWIGRSRRVARLRPVARPLNQFARSLTPEAGGRVRSLLSGRNAAPQPCLAVRPNRGVRLGASTSAPVTPGRRALGNAEERHMVHQDTVPTGRRTAGGPLRIVAAF